MHEPTPDDDPEIRAELDRYFAAATERAQRDMARGGMPLRTRSTLVRQRGVVPLGGLVVVVAIVSIALLGRVTTVGPAPTSTSAAGASVPAALAPPAAATWRAIAWSAVDETPFGGPGDQTIDAVVPWQGGFVAVGDELVDGRTSGIAWRSANGRNWTREAAPDGFAGRTLGPLVVASSGLVLFGGAYGGPGVSTAVWTSADGVTWQPLPAATALLASADVVGVTTGPAGVIAYGDQRETGAPAVWFSADGVAWRADSTIPSAPSTPHIQVAGTSWGYMATDGHAVWMSTDGNAWTLASTESTNDIEDLFVAAGGVVAAELPPSPCTGIGVCFGPAMLPTYSASPDGRSWTALDMPPFSDGATGARLFSGGGAIFDLDGYGAIWSSFDGRQWSQVASISDGLPSWAVQNLPGATGMAVGSMGIVAFGQIESTPSDVEPTRNGQDGAVWFGAGLAELPTQPFATMPIQ